MSEALANVYYHGGVPGLAVGDCIKPIENTSAFNTQEVMAAVARSGLGPASFTDLAHYSASVVYLTARRDVAAAFASVYVSPEGRPTLGDVYRVEPIGDLGVDPDFVHAPDLFFTAPRARIVKIERRRTRLTSYQACKATGPFMTWSDLTPMYDAEGYLLPSPEMRERGTTPAQCRRLGKWKTLEEVGHVR